jgi:hypothetical protein
LKIIKLQKKKKVQKLFLKNQIKSDTGIAGPWGWFGRLDIGVFEP